MRKSSLRRSQKSWRVYVVRCKDSSLYTGIATDVTRRISEHNTSSRRAAKYCWARRPVVLVWLSSELDHSSALNLELKIKRKKKAEKESMIGGHNE